MDEQAVVKNFGVANGWKKTPELVEKCNHKKIVRELGKCYREYRCDICGFVYQVDSSD